MITGIHGSTSIVVSGGNPSLPYVSQSNQPVVVEGRPCYNGDVRFMNGSYQVFTGYWQSTSTSAQISLMGEAETVLAWARKKMYEEHKLEQLMEKHPAIKDTKLQLDVLVALLKDQDA